jgi:hypothetical protein
MAFIIVVFLFPTTPHPSGANMNYTVVVFGNSLSCLLYVISYRSSTGGILTLSVLYFYFPVYGGVHWFHGPVSTIKDNISKRDVLPDSVEGENESEKATVENRGNVRQLTS